MKLRLQERHRRRDSEDCFNFLRTDLLKLNVTWADFLALDDRHTSNPAGLSNPIGYYRSLPRKAMKEFRATVHAALHADWAIKETPRCTKCKGGMIDGRFCDCDMGRDLANQAKKKQREQPKQSFRRFHHAPGHEQRGQAAQQPFPPASFYEALHVSEKPADWELKKPTGWTAEAAAKWLAARKPTGVVSSTELLLDYGACRRAYRDSARVLHPDVGGSAEQFQELVEVERVLEEHHRRYAQH